MVVISGYFSPLLKLITNGADVDYAMIDKDLQEREEFIAALESRFLFLAADARFTLRSLSSGFMKECILTYTPCSFSIYL